MRSGLMDRRLALKRRALGTQDAVGAYPDAAWTTYATVWARKIEVGAREFFVAQAKDAESTVRFEIRYRTDVVATDRVVCDGRDYELIAPPSEIGRREGLTLFARAIVNG
jgi:SPP1 family predicted phage head-tail adaptor